MLLHKSYLGLPLANVELLFVLTWRNATMLDILLSDELSHPTPSPETEKNQPIKRRQFLQRAGVTGLTLAGLALLPKEVFAGPAYAEPGEAGLWRDRVTGLVYGIFDDCRAQRISSIISNARVAYRPDSVYFHDYYSAPLVFVGTTISPEEVICGNGFELNRFPFYDIQCPCRGANDLNAFEIRRITNEKEVNRFGCVMAPHGARRPVELNDHSDAYQTISRYGLSPNRVKPVAKRFYTGNGRGRIGYQVVDTAQTGPKGEPVMDVLLNWRDV